MSLLLTISMNDNLHSLTHTHTHTRTHTSFIFRRLNTIGAMATTRLSVADKLQVVHPLYKIVE